MTPAAPRPPRSAFSDWSVAHLITDPATTIAIQISVRTSIPDRGDVVPIQQFSFQVGRFADDRFQRNFQSVCVVDAGQVHTVHFDSAVLVRLIGDAQEWVRQQRQGREDRVIAARRAAREGR